MVWIIGAVSMILFGGTLVAIGLALGTSGWTIIGGITVVGGLFLLFSFDVPPQHGNKWCCCKKPPATIVVHRATVVVALVIALAMRKTYPQATADVQIIVASLSAGNEKICAILCASLMLYLSRIIGIEQAVGIIVGTFIAATGWRMLMALTEASTLEAAAVPLTAHPVQCQNTALVFYIHTLEAK